MQDRNLFLGGNFFGERMTPGFNHEAFFAALDTERLSRTMTWKQVAEESRVPASSLSRMGKGKKPDVDSLAKLIRWSNLKTEDFIDRTSGKNSSSLAQMTALLRADPKLDIQSKKTLEAVIRSTYQSLLPKE